MKLDKLLDSIVDTDQLSVFISDNQYVLTLVKQELERKQIKTISSNDTKEVVKFVKKLRKEADETGVYLLFRDNLEVNYSSPKNQRIDYIDTPKYLPNFQLAFAASKISYLKDKVLYVAKNRRAPSYNTELNKLVDENL